MSKMRQFNLDTKTGIARIGPGWQWGELYSKLEPYNRTAVGGRYSTVGVGGLLLGGGSYLNLLTYLPTWLASYVVMCTVLCCVVLTLHGGAQEYPTLAISTG